ncbi:MAG: T9SS type A sorting domain-containing protein, partial [Rhodothermales bacterium]|nr:T9SS type A sorting domain-containing protein [Rhodothermales bacterium]
GVVAFETFESDFNTVLSVWSGTDHPLTEITCNDDWEDSRGDVTDRSYVDFTATAGTNYFIKVEGIDGEEGVVVLHARQPTTVAVDPIEEEIIPSDFSVSIYPNPVRARGSIEVGLPAAGSVQIELFDVLGRRVAEILSRDVDAGMQNFNFDTHSYPAGVYVIKITTKTSSIARAFTVIK